MPNLEWSDNLKVNISAIDTQHQKLVELVNKLFDAMKIGKGKSVTGEILKELADYTVYHFETEESLMEKYEYPDSDHHILAHKNLVDQVLAFQRKFAKGEITVTLELFKFLNNWLIDHIVAVDKKFGTFLKTKNVK